MADKTIKKNTIETLEDLELAMKELREAQKIFFYLHTGTGGRHFKQLPQQPIRHVFHYPEWL